MDTGKKSTADLITDMIGEYYRTGDKATAEQLLDLQRRLSCVKYALALQIGDLYTDKNGAEFRRKAAFFRFKKEGIDTGSSAAKAETDAENKIDELRKEEGQADALYKSAALILESTKDVLHAITQHIANLRQERREEMQGTGSQ